MKKGINNIMIFISEYNIPLSLFALYVFVTHALGIQNCILKLLIGYPCPGCGMSRAAFSLLRLDFIAAFHYNPFIFLLPFLFLGIALKQNQFVKKIMKSPWVWISITIVIFIVYILRFVYIYPNAPMDYYRNNLFSFILSIFK
ncbi:MAG: DUF2752 domain-containing protein [Anaeroplasmataceae bacterium]|nr:DUF2752 domain-containing protein [Anaeroplasmataceae bacterium]